MEEIPREQDEIDIGIPCNLQDLAESVDGVLTPHWILFGVTDVIVSSEEDTKAAEVRMGASGVLSGPYLSESANQFIYHCSRTSAYLVGRYLERRSD
jgi:hypothetical protein